MDTKKKPRPRGRPRTFDPDAALDAALGAFRTHGYEAATVALLREATGLTSPQLYNAFGDKEALFRAAVARYGEGAAAWAMGALAAPTAREAVGRFLKAAAGAYAEPGSPAGCLFVTGALAVSPGAEAVAELLRERRRATAEALSERVARGVAEGDVPAGADPVALGRFYAGVVHGMSVQALDGATADQLRRVGETAMRAWPDSAA